MRHKYQKTSVCLVIGLALLLFGFAAAADETAKETLVERLGFPADAKLLIVNGDDFGMNHATNIGTIDALKSGVLTSATVMVPCPWFPMAADFARKQPKANLGIHLVGTSEWGRYKWGPVLGRTAVPSLCTDQGYFWEGVREVYAHAKLDEVEKEVRAQIDKALGAGIDVTHIDSHMGTHQYDAKYFEMFVRVAKDYNLPCRFSGRETMEQRGAGYLIELAAKLGVLHPEFLFGAGPPSVEETSAWWKKHLAELKPGVVSEFYIHCGRETEEMHATTSTWKKRTADALFFSSPETLEYIKSLGIELISYRELRELQRTGKPMPRVERYGWE